MRSIIFNLIQTIYLYFFKISRILILVMTFCFRWCGRPAIRSVVLSEDVQTCMFLGVCGNRPPFWFATILSSKNFYCIHQYNIWTLKMQEIMVDFMKQILGKWKKRENNPNTYMFFFCSRGNWVGEAPYKTGKPCSACPSSYGGSCNKNQCDSRSKSRRNASGVRV